MAEAIRRTPLYERHLQQNARMVPFAGWEMPVQYAGGILAEHHHTRTAASLFDICHMGEFRISGPGAAAALDRRLARSVSDQRIGSCRYQLLLNESGGILDDLILYRLGEEEFFLVVNAGCRERDAQELAASLPPAVRFADESEQTGKLDLQGPLAAQVLTAACALSAAELPRYFHWRRAEVAGVACLLSRTGYTGELGFELYCAAAEVGVLWDRLLTQETVRPAGLGARDTLRLEAGLPLYGHELDERHTPEESGLAGLFPDSPGLERDYVGRAARLSRPVTSHSVAVVLNGRRAARAHAKLFVGGEAAGTITSGAFAPSLGCAIAFGRVDRAVAPGSEVTVEMERGTLTGTVVTAPFYANGSVRVKL